MIIGLILLIVTAGAAFAYGSYLMLRPAKEPPHGWGCDCGQCRTWSTANPKAVEKRFRELRGPKLRKNKAGRK